MITIHKASINDAVLLTELSRNIYKEHYLHLWHPGGAKWYMEEFAYAENAIQKDLLDSGIEYFIAADNGVPLGYLKIILAAQLAGNETLEALEVERIYLYKYAIGKGIGRQLMQVAMHKAKELKKSIIFLKTMDSSKEAIEFYIKLGFSICGSLQLPMPAFSLMKEEYRGMFILKGGVEE